MIKLSVPLEVFLDGASRSSTGFYLPPMNIRIITISSRDGLYIIHPCRCVQSTHREFATGPHLPTALGRPNAAHNPPMPDTSNVDLFLQGGSFRAASGWVHVTVAH
jgi:hypothetical protein